MDSSRLQALISCFSPARAEIWTCSGRGAVTLSIVTFKDPNGDNDATEQEDNERQLPSSGIHFPIMFLTLELTRAYDTQKPYSQVSTLLIGQ